jgi:hypothetical protein
MVRVDLDHVRMQRFGQPRPEVFRPWPQDERPYRRSCRGVILIQLAR